MPEIYRVDKFDVPDAALDAFWHFVRRTQAVLREQAGFLDAALLKKHAGPGRFNAVTIVRWASESDLPAARAAVEAAHAAADFSPAAFFADAGISADLATYVDLDA